MLTDVVDRAMEQVRGLMLAHDGLITRASAIQAGLTGRRIDLLLARGEWIAVHTGVFRRSDQVPTTRSRVRAAVLRAGPGATLSGAAAAFWWSMTAKVPGKVEVIVPPRRHPRPAVGVRMIRRTLDPVDTCSLSDLRVLDRPMAALRGAVALGRDGAQLLDRELQNGLPFPLVEQALVRQAGWHGSPRARELVRIAGDGAAAESERLFFGLLRASGITGWRPNAEVTINGRVYRPDASFAARRLAVEIDGWAWHSTPDRFRADRRRDNDFLLAGWRVLRFTWYDLTQQPRVVIREVRAALRTP
jgi:very-short-patch-repair endonuclease